MSPCPCVPVVGLLPGSPRSAKIGSRYVDVCASLLCHWPSIPLLLVQGRPAQLRARGGCSVAEALCGHEWSSQSLDHVLSGALASCPLAGAEEWASL